MVFKNLAVLEGGRGHRNTKRLGLIGTRNSAAIITAQDNDWPALQVWSKQPLATNKKVVAVNQGKNRFHPLYWWITDMTTPHGLSSGVSWCCFNTTGSLSRQATNRSLDPAIGALSMTAISPSYMP
jgi:hypothetical protein